MDRELLMKILALKGVNLEPDTTLRGMPGPMQYQPMVPNGPLGNPFLEDEAAKDAPQEAPRRSFMDKLRGGVQAPNSPIKYKNVGSRMFLRGLVGGFKASGDSPEGGDRGSRSGGSSNPLRDQYYAENIKSQIAARENLGKDREADNARDAKMDEIRALLYGAQAQSIPRDDARQEGAAAETARHNRVMESVAQQRARIYAENAAKASGAAMKGATDAEKRARLQILMKPIEDQADLMLNAKKGKKPLLKDNAKAETIRWRENIRTTLAKKLGVDLSVGVVEEAPLGLPTGDKLNGVMDEDELY
jgi:hypothetical protein